ncbi:hypothetical protein PV327_008261 [Microctonus hyperodae]|uniref:Contactin n=1 Tax=Microctonus hyperodae TaxID=165561 RepID=A0AA39F2R1_MICHY|nr:hypothetical protein PV327_008261 [Microctonus hyperodae]
MMGFIHLLATCLLASLSVIAGQNLVYYGETQYQCPKHWIKFQESCYRFIKTPLKRRDEARTICQAYQSDLVSINTGDEHTFILYHLLWQDPQHRRWYTGIKHLAGYWSNEVDGSQLINMEIAFLPEPNDGIMNRDYLAYAYSDSLKRWGLEKVTGSEELLYICEAAVNDLHVAVEDDRDYQYGIEVDNPLRIPRGPYFIRQPESKVFDVSKRNVIDEIILSCLAGGYPTPTYEWYIETYDNGRLMATKIDPLIDTRYTTSGGNLIIYTPQETDDRGSYHCKASNEFGTIISESVELTFGYILEFNLKRSHEKGDQNFGKVMYCDPPQYFPSVKYYWARNSFPNLVEEDQRVFVSNDGALYFSALEPIDAGNYSCNVESVTSDTGRNGPFFQLKVNPYASFQQLKFPNNFPKIFPEAVVVGEDVRLECVAFGYPVPSYAWRRKGARLPHNAVFSSFNRVLTIHGVQIEDQGEYTCRAYNDRFSIENSVYMSIQAEPNFTIPLEDKHMDNRGDLMWTCEAFGIPDVTYDWFKNGELLEMHTLPLENRDRYIIQDNVLKIKHLDREYDEGMYQCRAKNQLKSRYSSAQLRVLSMKPSFKKHPMEPETYAADRGNVTLTCNPEAAPKPTFVWKKDGNVLGSGGRRHILENGNLVISPVSRDDEGMYVCVATNTYGNDETRGRLLVLRGPNFIEQLPPRISTEIMNNQTLRCQADTDSMLDVAYMWSHNGILIRDQDLINNPRWRIDGGTFDIINITLSDGGDYECIIKSAVGSVVSKSTLIVSGPPGPPGGVQVERIDKLSAVLEWTDGAFNGKPIIMYTVSARTAFSDQWFNLTENITAIEINRYNSRKQANLEGVLNPFTTYEFRVSAANDLGYGPPSAPSPKYSTPPARPTRAPTNVGGGYGKQGELTITWDPLPPAYQNGRGVYYKIYWRRKGHETEFQSRSLQSYGNIGKYTVGISSEFYYTQYEVQVQPFNEAGEGPISNIATIYSAEDMPLNQPEQINAFSYNSTALNVTWQPLEETREVIRGKLIGYRLKYWRREDKEEDAIFYLSRTTRPWSLIVGLQPDTEYWVKVMAYNSAGAGPESERRLERTYRKAPQNPPSSVFIYEKNPSTVRVVWRYVQPSLYEEPLDGYKIRVWEIDQDMSTANDTVVPVGSKLEAYVTNLSPGKTYNLRVLAFSKGGDGRMSSPARRFQMGDPEMFRSKASYKIIDTGVIILVSIMITRLNFI